MPIKYTYHSLEDFLIANNADVDGQCDDGWGATFPVKGREIEATVLFADISGFSRRTLSLTPAETLIFVNNFFAWISAEALRGHHGIVDKYIGDEVMVVFAREFGSPDPFADALMCGRWMSENDYLAFQPHIGIASGPVIVGYVGTPLKYSASVFGAPVALAARCSQVKPEGGSYEASASIVFPANEWVGRVFEELFPPTLHRRADGTASKSQGWVLQEARDVDMKNLPDTRVREVCNRSLKLPSQPAEVTARATLAALQAQNRYWPRETQP